MIFKSDKKADNRTSFALAIYFALGFCVAFGFAYSYGLKAIENTKVDSYIDGVLDSVCDEWNAWLFGGARDIDALMNKLTRSGFGKQGSGNEPYFRSLIHNGHEILLCSTITLGNVAEYFEIEDSKRSGRITEMLRPPYKKPNGELVKGIVRD